MGNPADPQVTRNVNPNTDPKNSPVALGGVVPADTSKQAPVTQAEARQQASPASAHPTTISGHSQGRPAANQQEQRRTSSLIQNPKPPEKPVEEEAPKVPQRTLDEMAAGQAALERNRPTAAKLEEARKRADEAKNKA